MSVLAAHPKKATYFTSQSSCSCSTEQGKENKNKSLAAPPLPPPQTPRPTVAGTEEIKIIKNTGRVHQSETQKDQMTRRALNYVTNTSTCCLGAIQVLVPLAPVQGWFGSSTINKPIYCLCRFAGSTLLRCTMKTTFPVSLRRCYISYYLYPKDFVVARIECFSCFRFH